MLLLGDICKETWMSRYSYWSGEELAGIAKVMPFVHR